MWLLLVYGSEKKSKEHKGTLGDTMSKSLIKHQTPESLIIKKRNFPMMLTK